jgi:selenide,water dikinase
MVGYEDAVPAEVRTMLFDPQTAGGLLISAAEEDCKLLLESLDAAGVSAVKIGEVLPRTKTLIAIQL